MSNFSDFIGGGGGSASYPTIFLHNSQTWVPPQDGNIMIHVIGAGGSGFGGNTPSCTSGAAGGYCRKNSLAVTTSGSFTVVVGAGGARVGNSTQGIAGGTTSVSGTGLPAGTPLRAFGGGGGLSGANPSVGGVATGGDVNNTGGNSVATMSGGGAVGLLGTGNAGQLPSFGYAGGDCDVIGDLWSSSFGKISGSRGSDGVYFNSNSQYRPANTPVDAGPLAGGGVSRMDKATQYGRTLGGSATIGGGGGSCDNSGGASYGVSGRGGEGIVIIQYLPA